MLAAKQSSIRQPLLSGITYLLIILWVYAASSKLLDYETSRQQMLNQVFPFYISNVLIWLVPILELSAAGLLCYERTRNAGLKISLFLLVLFTGYIGMVMLNVFDRTPCSCGGILEEMSWRQHLVFNLFFIVLLWFALFTHPQTSHIKKFSLKTGPDRSSPAAGNTSAGLQHGYGKSYNEKLPRIRAPAEESNRLSNPGEAAP